jgi:starch phosphorylase
MPSKTTTAKPAASTGRPHPDSPEAIFRSLIKRHLISTLARHEGSATPRDWWVATALAVRDTIHERMIATQAVHNAQNVRRIYYFSLEYLMGRLFGNNLLATGLYDTAAPRSRLPRPGLREDPRHRESTWAWATAASAASRRVSSIRSRPSITPRSATASTTSSACSSRPSSTAPGGASRQLDAFRRSRGKSSGPNTRRKCAFYGRIENVFDDRGNYRPRWVDTKTILGVPHDIPIAGYGTGTVNLLRLWASKATEDFDLAAFNSGGYVEAVREKAIGETVSKVLYPNDKTENGKELRLVQQYFFVACSLRDIIRRHFRKPATTFLGTTLPTRWPCSSTTRTPPSPSWSSCASSSTRKTLVGRRPGPSSADLRLHQPHAAARGAGKVGRRPL